MQYNVAFDEFIDEETNEKLIEEDVLASRVRPRFVPPPATSEWTLRDGDRIEYLQDDVWWECDVLMVDSTGTRGKAAGTRPGGQLFVRTVATWAAQWRHRVDRDGARSSARGASRRPPASAATAIAPRRPSRARREGAGGGGRRVRQKVVAES